MNIYSMIVYNMICSIYAYMIYYSILWLVKAGWERGSDAVRKLFYTVFNSETLICLETCCSEMCCRS